MKRLLVLLTLVFPTSLAADEVFLKGGGRISGVVVDKTETVLVVDVGPGRVGLPLSRVERVVSGTAPLTLYRQRAQQLAPGDVEGWIALARWAEEHDLSTQAREAYQRVLAVDPENAAAQQALGRVLVDGRWMSVEDSYRARGFVDYGGRWVTPAEREALVRERADAVAAERARDERRVQEADAEARAREDEARRSEAAEAGYGIPLYGPYGGAYGPATCCSHPRRPPRSAAVAPPAPPPVVVTPPPRSEPPPHVSAPPPRPGALPVRDGAGTRRDHNP